MPSNVEIYFEGTKYITIIYPKSTNVQLSYLDSVAITPYFSWVSQVISTSYM